LGILAALYVVRILVIKLFVQKDIIPQIWLAPRGLITILLFFAIPAEYETEAFDSGILLYTIIISCIIMAASLVANGKKVIPVDDMTFIYGPTPENTDTEESLDEEETEKVG
jgi:NhaP-type Na+/H+ or K+/H+ antiporter